MKQKKFPSPTGKKSSAISTKAPPKFRKVARLKISKKKKIKGHAIAQAFAATPKKKTQAAPMPKWMVDDFIPMRHARSGRPLGNHCTCKAAPTKYCWKCKTWAARPAVNLDPHLAHAEVNEAYDVDLWSDAMDIPNR